MRNDKKIAALVLAAGSSTRAPGFKPLLPLGKGTVIEAVINIFNAAGIDDVVVVTGHRANDLVPTLDRLRVRHVLNDRYQEGMFSSIVAGVKSLRTATDAFFLLPADMPLVRCHTITRLRKAYSRTEADVIYPVFQRLRGHPPLISAKCCPAILSWDRPEGLRSLLMRYELTSKDVDVMDEGILIDVDTAEDYRRAAERFTMRGIPQQREIEAILTAAKTPEGASRHCRMVAEMGRVLGDALNRAGLQLDVNLITAGGMLHDLAKSRPHHARAGARMLLAMGYPDVAKIVAAHHTIDFKDGLPLDEASILFLADKLVLGDRIVSLDERFSECLTKYAKDTTVLHEVKQRLKRARILEKTVEQMTGMRLKELVQEKGHEASWTGNKEVVQG
jgi:CTP:molybdopterin cytidylyltransferase MocA